MVWRFYCKYPTKNFNFLFFSNNYMLHQHYKITFPALDNDVSWLTFKLLVCSNNAFLLSVCRVFLITGHAMQLTFERWVFFVLVQIWRQSIKEIITYGVAQSGRRPQHFFNHVASIIYHENLTFFSSYSTSIMLIICRGKGVYILV